jgi:hypothetical protein
VASGAPPQGEREPGPSHDPEREPAPGEGLGRFLLPFFSDSTLWPVTFVGAAILVTFVAGIALFALAERNPFALAALALLVVMSGDAVWRDVRRRGFGTASRVIVGLWCLVALAAGAAVWLGLF